MLVGMFDEEHRKWGERQMPSSSSVEALTKQNMRADLEDKIKKREERQKALAKLKERVDREQLKQELKKNAGASPTSGMKKAEQLKGVKIDEKGKSDTMIERRKAEDSAKQESKKIEKGKDQV